jgi:dTDP-glucose pyrophosphorylase
MKSWRDVLVQPSTTIREAMERIDRSATQLALVTDADGRLVGTVSDGDVRRGLLASLTLEDSVERVMNRKPTSVVEQHDRAGVVALMQARGLRFLPVLDASGRVVGLHSLDEALRPPPRDNVVVLMAGGAGERLRPLTERTPKPMLLVGGRPILETIVVQLVAQGFRRFVLSVNYRAEVIEEYFGSGSRWGIDISYVREPKRLGTAGSLRLLTERPTKPLIVMNGDILTKLDVRGVLEFHEEKSAAATMCVREHEYQVPFGVVQTDGIDIAAFDEKPVVRWPVNAGIYVLSPSSLDAIPSDTFFDMPALFDKLRETAARTVAYTIRDFWMDIGRPADFERANLEFDGAHDRGAR